MDTEDEDGFNPEYIRDETNTIPDEILQEIVDEFNTENPADTKLDLETARRHFKSLPFEFNEKDLDTLLNAIQNELLGRDLSRMVDKGLLELSVNDSGEFVFYPTKLGKQLGDELRKEK